MIELMVRVREVTVTRKELTGRRDEIRVTGRGEEEEKRLCEKKRGPEASLNKHRRVKIYEFPIMPFNQFTGYYTLIPGVSKI